MARAKTPSFIVEVPLKTTAEDERLLLDRFLCAKKLNNTLLQNGIEIVNAMRSSDEWRVACKIRQNTDEAKKLKAETFGNIRKAHGFSKPHFENLIKTHAEASGFNKRIGSHECQALAEKVFNALNEWVLGKRGKPRFKGRKRPLHSIQGKNNDGMLRWLNQGLQINRHWRIEAVLPDLKKTNEEWLTDALTHRTKYCRILWRNINGQKRWYVQLIQEGLTPIPMKHLNQRQHVQEDAVCGIDIGPSELAYASATEAGKIRLCAGIDRDEAAIRLLQRHIDRMRRAANPDNYHANGTVKKGVKSWRKSNRQLKAEAQLRERQRKEAATRKRDHGQLANTLLTKAKIFKDDGVSAKALQKNYGTSSSKRASGLMMSILERKAERAGGKRIVINVRALKNSQYDHTTRTFKKKPLSQRQHVFGDGRGVVDRDVYSAFLARVSGETTYNPSVTEKAWRVLEDALVQSGLFAPSATRRDGEMASSMGVVAKQQPIGTVLSPLERFDCETTRQPAIFSPQTEHCVA